MRARAIAGHSIRKAALPDLDAAFRIVEEYYDAANVLARDTKQEFQHYYFGERSGVWLASINDRVVGCIALRELPEIQRSGEIKRMYVRPAHRGSGIAKQLLDALEQLPQKPATNGSTSIPRQAWTPPFAFTSATGFNLALLTTTIPKPTFFFAKGPVDTLLLVSA